MLQEILWVRLGRTDCDEGHTIQGTRKCSLKICTMYLLSMNAACFVRNRQI